MTPTRKPVGGPTVSLRSQISNLKSRIRHHSQATFDSLLPDIVEYIREALIQRSIVNKNIRLPTQRWHNGTFRANWLLLICVRLLKHDYHAVFTWRNIHRQTRRQLMVFGNQSDSLDSLHYQLLDLDPPPNSPFIPRQHTTRQSSHEQQPDEPFLDYLTILSPLLPGVEPPVLFYSPTSNPRPARRRRCPRHRPLPSLPGPAGRGVNRNSDSSRSGCERRLALAKPTNDTT